LRLPLSKFLMKKWENSNLHMLIQHISKGEK
jgi:hypothetical protein